ncbi:MAG TPA: ferritin-like domain-containing protein [Smithellaceae bacterium]|nr:ferritin-like domain-containing protein [Smithellaceae bacterium]HQM44354.1 ferritin-like domain-containing protein [Smithellaceae bacterium]
MEALKNQIQKSFRMEMIGTGLYDALAKQYGRKDQKLGKRLQTFSNDERMHGRLFQKCSQNLFGTPPQGEALWQFVGKMAAWAMRPLPLEAKLKKLSIAEKQAVERIEKALAAGENTSFHKAIRVILRDEKTHAKFYDEWRASSQTEM